VFFYFFIIPPPSLFLVHSVKSFPSDDVKENFSYGIFSMQQEISLGEIYQCGSMIGQEILKNLGIVFLL